MASTQKWVTVPHFTMSKKPKLPIVAICGRPNVGKSTLYNRILGKQRAIVHGVEGITRDRHDGVAEWEGRKFRIVDTGGIVETPEDAIVRKMQDQVRIALKDASAIIFVLDGQEDLTRVDHEFAQELFRLGKPVFLAVNKLDNPAMDINKHNFHELGIGEPIPVSSGHGLGVGALMDLVMEALPEPGEEIEEEEEVQVTRIAVVGKPNAGKSSFINALLNEERTIVDETPGTTRDAIDIDFRWQDKQYVLIDTAGMRKKAGIKQPVEQFSVARSLRAVRRADVCLVMIDALEGIAEQDKRIIGYAREQGVAMVWVWTKWDLVDDKERKFKALADEIDLKIPHLKYVPYVTVSNITRQRVFSTLEYVDRIAAEAQKRISTGELNRFLESIRDLHKPSQHKGKYAKILYMTQSGVKPTTFILFVNQKRLFHFSYLRYIENRLRERFGFDGVPIQLHLREEKPRT